MEIPYVIEPRKDTGLTNSKIGIWLFLASEVMLFGGLFSGYIFLRIYADYPWPERTLPVLPGLINTFILIGSSVTVVFAWVALKLRQWGKFQMYMSITLICAALFMVLKGFEYKAKFSHQAIRLDDYTVIEGHAYPQKFGHDDHADDDGGKHKGPTKNKNIIASSVTIDPLKVDDIYYKKLAEQYEAAGFALSEDVILGDKTVITKGTPLSLELCHQVETDMRDALANNSELDIKAQRLASKAVKAEMPGKKYYEKGVSEFRNKKLAEFKDVWKKEKKYLDVVGTLSFSPKAGHANISVHPYWGKLSTKVKGESGQLGLKDGTVFTGTIGDSSIELHVDGIDFRHTVMKADERGIDPIAAINNSWLLKNENMKKLWDKHLVFVEKLREEHEGVQPTESELYRMDWQEIVALEKLSESDMATMKYSEIEDLFPGDIEGFTGPNHKKVHYPAVIVPREEVRFESLFTPRWNTYYAIYFTITGLHGLHVIAGAFVLAYYMFFGRKMYQQKPEWLANRVEIGGLFWHFVDLVWIFVFPILYLM